jgi:hypothetical protein
MRLLSDARVGTRLVKRRVGFTPASRLAHRQPPAARRAFGQGGGRGGGRAGGRASERASERHVEDPSLPLPLALTPVSLAFSDPEPDGGANALSRAARVPHLPVILSLFLSLSLSLCLTMMLLPRCCARVAYTSRRIRRLVARDAARKPADNPFGIARLRLALRKQTARPSPSPSCLPPSLSPLPPPARHGDDGAIPFIARRFIFDGLSRLTRRDTILSPRIRRWSLGWNSRGNLW